MCDAKAEDFIALANRWADISKDDPDFLILLAPPAKTISLAEWIRQQRTVLHNVATCDSNEVISIDKNDVRRHLEIIHNHAGRLVEGIENTGYLQLSRLHPATDSLAPERFRIGDIEGMAKVAIAAAESGQNVYIEGRTVRHDLRGMQRGGAEDTRLVFALVIDSDADKDMAANLSIEPSLVVETSPGNAHFWFLLECPVGPVEAADLGLRIRAAVHADHDTGTITQPYRLAGTPNFPGRTKRERGRVTVATRIAASGLRLWSPDELRAVFPEVPMAHEKETLFDPNDDLCRSRLIDSINAIPAYEYDVWYKVGMVLYDTGWPDAFEIWRRWSRTCPEKYNKAGTYNSKLQPSMRKKWVSFGKRHSGRSVGPGTIFAWAYEFGWNDDAVAKWFEQVQDYWLNLPPDNPDWEIAFPGITKMITDAAQRGTPVETPVAGITSTGPTQAAHESEPSPGGESRAK